LRISWDPPLRAGRSFKVGIDPTRAAFTGSRQCAQGSDGANNISDTNSICQALILVWVEQLIMQQVCQRHGLGILGFSGDFVTLSVSFVECYREIFRISPSFGLIPAGRTRF
jgi:hypothetical protein